MNSPVKMFQTRQILRHDLKISLPNCMYKMKNIHASEDDRKRLDDHVSPSNQKPNITDQHLVEQTDMGELVNRQEKILRELDELRQQIITLKSNLDSSCSNATARVDRLGAPNSVRAAGPRVQIDNRQIIVINVSQSYPPYSLLLIKKLWKNYINLAFKTYCHSSVASLSEEAIRFSQELEVNDSPRELPVLSVKLIWKNVGANTELIISQIPIIGETNILRYLARLSPNHLNYENLANSVELDAVLDICYCLVRSKTKTERSTLLLGLNKKLGKSDWFCGCSNVTVADLAVISSIKQVASSEINQTMTKWLQKCNAIIV